MGLSLKREGYQTFNEWLSWDEGVRAELVDGEAVMMALPSQKHQEIIMELSRQLANFLKGKPFKVYPAPFRVRLSKKEHTVFEPDIVLICDKSRLGGKIFNGAPDMVVEVLSPTSARHDRLTKYQKYQHAGVREYWIVDPDIKTVHVCLLENGRYIMEAYGDTDIVPVSVLEGCEITLADVFDYGPAPALRNAKTADLAANPVNNPIGIDQRRSHAKK